MREEVCHAKTTTLYTQQFKKEALRLVSQKGRCRCPKNSAGAAKCPESSPGVSLFEGLDAYP